MKTIITLTVNPAIDTSTRIANVAINRKLRCEKPRHEPGGGGINVSRVITLLGGKSRAVYPAGGCLGEMLKRLLDDLALDHYPVAARGMTRENFKVFERSSGQQYRFLMPGPETTREECDRLIDTVGKLEPEPAYVVASGSLPPGAPEDFYAQLGERFDRSVTRYIVDTSGSPLRRAVEAGVYMLKPNMSELRDLTGRDIDNEQQQEDAARELVERGACTIAVVSLGAMGAMLIDEKGRVKRVRSPSVRVESRVGAGDSMVGAMAYAMANGKTIPDAVAYGVAAGAAAVMTPGTELCRKHDVEKLYRTIISS